MKTILILFTLTTGILYSGQAFCQATETTAKIADAEHPAFTENYAYPPHVVTDAILARLKKDGVSGRSKKGMITATAVRYPVLSSEALDLYFQVSGRGRKDKDGSAVTFFVSKGRDNFIDKSSDATLARNARKYLDNLQQDISSYALQLQITQQQKLLDKQTNSYKKLLKDGQKLESKRYSLQRDVSGEMDPSKQDKLKRKLQKLDRNINDKQLDIKQSQRDLQRQKDQLSLLQDQLNRQPGR